MDLLESIEQTIEESFDRLLFDEHDPLKTFEKSKYAEHFDDYCNRHEKVLSAIVELSGALKMEDYIDFCDRLADAFMQQVLRRFEGLKPRKADTLLTDYNLVMAVYLLPAIQQKDKRGGAILGDALIRMWKQHFPKTDLKLAMFDDINNGFRHSFCYITTAVCKSLGKDEDCTELNALRAFRDGYMQQDEQGRELIREYYDIAPSIVKHIDRLENCDKIYYNIWKEYLSPCLDLLDQGKNKECMGLYVKMVNDLRVIYQKP